jgi:WD40 repeat protein
MKNKQITHRLPGHTKRVLSLAINPCDDSMICSLSSDETIRFWNLQKSKDSHNRIGNRNS